MNFKISVIQKFLLGIYVIFFLGGCSSAMQLYYEKPPAKEMNQGEINVIVDDQRPPDQGGDDPTRVGTVRNTFGMPFPLNATPDRGPSKVIKELVSDCLKASGYNVTEQTGNVPELYVVLKEFWSDGYQHSRIWTTIPVELKKDNYSKPVWEHTFESNIGATWTVGYGPFNKGINEMLEDLKRQMIFEFMDPRFNNSMKSLKR